VTCRFTLPAERAADEPAVQLLTRCVTTNIIKLRYFNIEIRFSDYQEANHGANNWRDEQDLERELRVEARGLIAKADYKDTIAKLKKAQEEKKKKKK
jgi:hypothetical protein